MLESRLRFFPQRSMRRLFPARPRRPWLRGSLKPKRARRVTAECRSAGVYCDRRGHGGRARRRNLGKPRDAAHAREMLAKLSGRTHRVLTGIFLLRLPDGDTRAAVEITSVTFASLGGGEIDDVCRDRRAAGQSRGVREFKASPGATFPESKAAISMWWGCRWRGFTRCCGN